MLLLYRFDLKSGFLFIWKQFSSGFFHHHVLKRVDIAKDKGT